MRKPKTLRLPTQGAADFRHDVSHRFSAWRVGCGLRAKGKLICLNDLWIAATALERDLALVTRNTAEFSRVPGLKIKGY